MTDPGDTSAIRDILDFWFLPPGDPEHGKAREIWWRSNPDFDTGRFGMKGKFLELKKQLIQVMGTTDR